jgi:hypothetical protein
MLNLITSGMASSFFLDSSSHLVPAFRRQTSFDFVLLVNVMLSQRKAWNKFLYHEPLGPLFGELLRFVLVLCWDARSLRVLLMPIVSCHKELCVLWLCASLRLLSLIFSYCIWPALLRTCPTLLFVAWHGVCDLLLVCSFFL